MAYSIPIYTHGRNQKPSVDGSHYDYCYNLEITEGLLAAWNSMASNSAFNKHSHFNTSQKGYRIQAGRHGCVTVILIHSYPYPTVIRMKNGDVYLIHIYNKILFLSYKINYNINHILFGWHHQLDGHEFEKAQGVGDGQGSLVCCSPWDCVELDTTERLN